MTNQTELTINEKVEQFEQDGWRYIHDGIDWTSGSWYHDEHGSVNNGGGSFRWIGQAVEALEKFISTLEMCKN